MDGIDVPENLRNFPYRATFDSECYFSRHAQLPGNSEKLTWEAEHIPLSASVCSSVPGNDEQRSFVSTGDTSDLISRFSEYLVAISDTSYFSLLEHFTTVFEEMDNHMPDESGSQDEVM